MNTSGKFWLSNVSGGIFAPMIRYHQGKFYMVAANITGVF